MSAAGPGPRICRRWTRWYTRRLPDDVAGGRYGEIVSDLWEHERDARDAGRSRTRYHVAVVRRTVAGVPADLAWRRSLRHLQVPAGGEAVPLGRPIDQLLVVLTGLAAFPAAAIFPLLLTARLTGPQVMLVVAPALLAALLVVGLVLRSRDTRPVVSTMLLVAGAPAPSLAVFWLPPVYLLSLAIVVTALVSMPRRRRTVARS